MACLLFDLQAGVRPALVAYRGTAPALNDLIGGHVDFFCEQVVSVAPQIAAGTIKAYAVSSSERLPTLPEVPTAKELGVDFAGEMCAMVCHIEGLDRPNNSGSLTGGEIESRRRLISDVPTRLPGAYCTIKLSALRGDELGMIAAFRESSQVREIADAVVAEIGRLVPGTAARIGISRPTPDPMTMPTAWKDARVALERGTKRFLQK